MREIIKTDDGYMVQLPSGDYLCDDKGDNLFDTSVEASALASKPPCLYCGGNCPNDEDHACDGYLGDIDGLYSEDAK